MFFGQLYLCNELMNRTKSIDLPTYKLNLKRSDYSCMPNITMGLNPVECNTCTEGSKISLCLQKS